MFLNYKKRIFDKIPIAKKLKLNGRKYSTTTGAILMTLVSAMDRGEGKG